jgi:radical SAM superfamily enzyme
MFEDEIFGMDAKWLQQFTPLYREKVGLPFSAYLYPTRNIDKLLPLLKEAGLTSCCISLQTGSERIHKQVFDRPYDRKLFLHTIELCRLSGVAFYTDVITFNPYEEAGDLEKTLDVLLEIRGPYGLCINKLFVLPGTSLAVQMNRDGKDLDVAAREDEFGYYCRLFSIASLSVFGGHVVRMVRRLSVFRRKPAWIPMAAIEFGLRVANAIHRRLPRRKITAPPTPPAPPTGGKPELVVLGPPTNHS